MKLPWRSHREGSGKGAGSAAGACFESVVEVESQTHPGVRLRIVRTSFARRVELLREVRELMRRVTFLSAGKDPQDKMDALLLKTEIDGTFVRWGVQGVSGLQIDGIPANPADLAAGPEDLFREALAAVKRELGLTEEERKN